MVNVQKRLKGASAEANFWHGENIEHVEKQLQIKTSAEPPFMVILDF